MKESEIKKLILEVAALFPHQAPGEWTAREWAKSRRLRSDRVTYADGLQAVRNLADRQKFIALSELCDETHAVAGVRVGILEQKQLEARQIPAITGDAEAVRIAASSVAYDVFERVVKTEDFRGEVELRRGMTIDQIEERRAELRTKVAKRLLDDVEVANVRREELRRQAEEVERAG